MIKEDFAQEPLSDQFRLQPDRLLTNSLIHEELVVKKEPVPMIMFSTNMLSQLTFSLDKVDAVPVSQCQLLSVPISS